MTYSSALLTTTGTDTPCDDPGDWFSDEPDRTDKAKLACRGCRVRSACLAGALERGEPTGVWGEHLFSRGRPVPAGYLSRDQARNYLLVVLDGLAAAASSDRIPALKPSALRDILLSQYRRQVERRVVEAVLTDLSTEGCITREADTIVITTKGHSEAATLHVTRGRQTQHTVAA